MAGSLPGARQWVRRSGLRVWAELEGWPDPMLVSRQVDLNRLQILKKKNCVKSKNDFPYSLTQTMKAAVMIPEMAESNNLFNHTSFTQKFIRPYSFVLKEMGTWLWRTTRGECPVSR